MTENIFSAVLTLSLLTGGAIAFGSELAQAPAPRAAQTATLPEVTVIGQRIAAQGQVTMPTVVVVGRRCAPDAESAGPTEVAAETNSVEHRVQ